MKIKCVFKPYKYDPQIKHLKVIENNKLNVIIFEDGQLKIGKVPLIDYEGCTFELIGPNIEMNKHQLNEHVLVEHGMIDLDP